MSNNQIVRTTFTVGRRWKCTLVCDPNAITPGSNGRLLAQWEPGLPDRPLSKAEMRQYREGRDTFFRRVSEMAGLRGLLVEI